MCVMEYSSHHIQHWLNKTRAIIQSYSNNHVNIKFVCIVSEDPPARCLHYN